MRVLVTGATGCLGRHVLLALRSERDHEVICVARGNRESASVRSVDLTDARATKALLGDVQPEVIFHCAGGASGDLEADLRLNVNSSRWLMEAARNNGNAARIVLVGSAAEYGIVYPADNPVSEDRVLRPTSAYGASKAMQTALATYFAASRGVDVVVGRLFNLYAESMSPGLFVGRVQAQIEEYRRGERQTIEVGNLDSQRDYIDATDAAQLLLKIAKFGAAGHVYNVGTGKPIRMRNLLDRLLVEAGVEGAAVRSKPSVGKPSLDVPLIFADMRKTETLIRAYGDRE